MITGAISGSRYGATLAQEAELRDTLYKLREFAFWLNHGDCKGIDELGYHIWKGLAGNTRCYPPINDKYRAFTAHNNIVYPTDTYHARNRNLVNDANLLIACPKEDNNKGGTWHAINYADKAHKLVKIILPDGTFRYLNKQ